MVLLHLYSFSSQLIGIAWKTASIQSSCVFLVAYFILKYITLDLKVIVTTVSCGLELAAFVFTFTFVC